MTNIIESAEQAGEKVGQPASTEDESSTRVVQLDYPSGSRRPSIKLILDADTRLLARMEWTERRGDEERYTTISFDYPDPGPPGIYALGIPAGATVYDTRPSGPALAWIVRVRERFARGCGDHVAVLLESRIADDGALVPMYVSVFHQKGGAQAMGPLPGV